MRDSVKHIAFALAVVALGLLIVRSAQAKSDSAEVTIGVFNLFHPHELVVTPSGGNALVLNPGTQSIVLERSSGISKAHISLFNGVMSVTAGSRALNANRVILSGRADQPVDFEVSVPGRIHRHFHGTLEIRPSGSELLAIVTMDREIAVSSIVAAENPSGTPIEALKAQAVVTRSYLLAAVRRHADFDFCDTTHCQFLREPPSPQSNIAKAVETTKGLVLTHKSQIFAAMYTRSCSGRTHTPAQLGLSTGPYPYYSVECAYCQSHPDRWSTRIANQDALDLHASDESARLKIVRRLGWSTVPSNDFVMRKEKSYTFLEGSGQGHGIGLCQAGAKAMAEAGANFREILGHYYPNTEIEPILR